MRRSSDIAERLARIEESMATREDVAGLRAEIARIRRAPPRRYTAVVVCVAVLVGLLAPVVLFELWPEIVP